MSSILRSHAQQLLVLASFSGSLGAFGCSSGFSSCLELATCGGSSGEGGGGGAPDDSNPGAGTASASSADGAGAGGSDDGAPAGDAGGANAAGAAGDAGASGGAGASADGASGHAGVADSKGGAGSPGSDEGEGGARGDQPTPAGGVGGVGGEEAPECQSDAACDDGAGCNGLERCVEGTCEAGEAVVCVSDADGCEAVCEEQPSGARCVPRAADGDGDGHGSSKCQASFGDDCNDRDSSVHAGAPELCDLLDNDCDGSVDLSDGLSLESSRVTLSGFSPSVVWSEHHAAFGVMWVGRSGNASQLHGGKVSTAGVFEPWPVPVFSSTSATYLAPSLVASDSGFAAVYQTGSRGGQLSHLAEIESDGTAQTTPLDALHSDIAVGQHGWLYLAGERAGWLKTEIRMRGAGNAASTHEGASPMSPRIAVVDSQAAVIWQVKDTLRVEGLFDNFDVITPRVGVTEGAASPDITAAGDGYAAAWSTADGVFHQRMAVDGSLPCIGTGVTLRENAISDRSLAIAATDQHSFVLVTDRTSNVLNLLRFDEECRLIDQAQIEAGAVASKPAIAVGGGHVAACWSEGTSEDHSECRVMGIDLCDSGS